MVDLFSPKGAEQFGCRYYLQLSLKIPSSVSNVSLHFALHPDKDKRTLLLGKYKDSNTLNLTVNERLRELPYTPKTFRYGKEHEFKAKSDHHVYLVWAESIKIVNVNHIPVATYEDELVIFTKNGYDEFGPFIFVQSTGEKVPASHCVLSTSFQEEYWCLESDAQLNPERAKVNILAKSKSKLLTEARRTSQEQQLLDEVDLDVAPYISFDRELLTREEEEYDEGEESAN